MAERIVSAIAADFVIQGRTLKVSCSLGISIYPEDGADSEALIKNADAAMYGAKETGRNRFLVFTKEMNAKCWSVRFSSMICAWQSSATKFFSGTKPNPKIETRNPKPET